MRLPKVADGGLGLKTNTCSHYPTVRSTKPQINFCPLGTCELSLGVQHLKPCQVLKVKDLQQSVHMSYVTLPRGSAVHGQKEPHSIAIAAIQARSTCPLLAQDLEMPKRACREQMLHSSPWEWPWPCSSWCAAALLPGRRLEPCLRTPSLCRAAHSSTVSIRKGRHVPYQKALHMLKARDAGISMSIGSAGSKDLAPSRSSNTF